MLYKTMPYLDAVRLNNIIFSNYVANFNPHNLSQAGVLQQEFQQVFNEFNIVLTPEEEGWLNDLTVDIMWQERLAEVMIEVYQLRTLLPVYTIVQSPAQLQLIQYLNNFGDGTYSYYNLFFANPEQDQTLPITQLVINAATDPNIPLADRQFIQSIIG